MESFTYVATLVLALTAVAKRAGLKSKYLPIFAVIAGIGCTYLFDGFSTTATLAGLVTALTSMGLYSGVKTTVQ